MTDPAALLRAAARGLARRRGLEAPFLRRFPEVADTAAAAEGPDSPEGLGDLLEAARDPERAAAFTALLDGSLRHTSTEALSTTQRFTPPWLARWMAAQALPRAAQPQTVLDPACGGGSLLLTAWRVLRAQGHAPADLIGRICGADLDPVAAATARYALWLEAAAEADPDALPSPRVYALAGSADLDLLGALAPFEALADATAGALAPGAFDAVLANPPYMSQRHMAPALREALTAACRPFHGDLYTAFLRRCVELTRPGGALALLCQASFLALLRDADLRRDLLARLTPTHLLHLGAGVFEALAGEKASVVALTALHVPPPEGHAIDVIDLRDLRNPGAKADTLAAALADAPDARWRRTRSAAAFARARRGEPFAPWWPDALAHLLDLPDRLGERVTIPGVAHKTADNARFVRRWWEVPAEHIGPDADPAQRFVSYAKGGPHRRWVGNLEHVVDWSDQARLHYRRHPTAHLLPEPFWYRAGLTWSDLGGQRFSCRLLPAGGAFDMAGPALFPPDEGPPHAFWLALLNAPLICHLLNADNPTLHYQVSNLRRLPLPPLPEAATAHLGALGEQALRIAARLDADALTSPAFTSPRLATVPGDTLPDRLANALGAIQADLDALAALEARIADAVKALYGAPREALAPLDRRYQAPALTSPGAEALLHDALLHAAAAAEGRFALKEDAAGDLEAAGRLLYPDAVWDALRDATTGRRLRAFLDAWPRPLDQRFGRRRPWHPARVLHPLKRR